MAAGALTVVGVFGGGAWMLSGRGDEPVDVPVQVVPGWGQQAVWVSPGLLSADPVGRTVLVSGELVFITVETSDGAALAALRAADGETVWTSPLEGPLTGPPQLITYDGGPAVVAATATALLIWPADAAGGDQSPQRWSFTEADVILVPDSPTPLLVNRETLTALVLVDGALRKRELPSPAVPLLVATSAGEVVAVTETGHRWVLSGEGPSRQRSCCSPGYGSLVVDLIGVGGHTVIVSWSRGKDGGYLVGYDAERGMRPRWELPTRAEVKAEDVKISPDGSWLIASRTAVEVESGRGRSLGAEWETVGITDTVAWSRGHEARKGAGSTRLARPVRDLAGVPVAITHEGGALVVASPSSGGVPRVYAVAEG